MELNKLPKAYKELAKQRQSEYDANTRRFGVFCLSGDYQFLWGDTPEGTAFWHDVYYAKTIDDLPPIPKTTEPERVYILAGDMATDIYGDEGIEGIIEKMKPEHSLFELMPVLTIITNDCPFDRIVDQVLQAVDGCLSGVMITEEEYNQLKPHVDQYYKQ